MLRQCNRAVVCYDHQRRPCLRPKGHTFRCNPWSASYIATDNPRKKTTKIGVPSKNRKFIELAS